jgi:hypothetical protein
MKDVHTDIAIIGGGITAPLWVNALTGWFALGTAVVSFVVVCGRAYSMYRSRKQSVESYDRHDS